MKSLRCLLGKHDLSIYEGRSGKFSHQYRCARCGTLMYRIDQSWRGLAQFAGLKLGPDDWETEHDAEGNAVLEYY